MSVCYPKTPVGGVGVGEHTDQGFLTILNQDMVGGLEVKVDGKWIKVVPEKGTLVINIGDMMEKFTNKVVSFGYTQLRQKSFNNLSNFQDKNFWFFNVIN